MTTPSSEDGSMEIVSTVSHELRSPLTSIKGYTALLLHRWDKLDDAQKQMMLEQVHRDADRVTRLLNELLDISRLETGRLTLRRQRVDIARLAGEVIEKVRLQFPDLEATVSFGADFPAVNADPDKVEQVLTNLLENAAKYGNPQGLRVVGRLTGDRAEVAVHDQGEGIATEDLPRVFEKFFHRDRGRPTGTGLGLWIARGLVEAHGGTLSADSTPGQGSVFTFSLPTGGFDDLPDGADRN